MSKQLWFSAFLVTGIVAGPVLAQSLVAIDPATVSNGHVYLMDNVGANLPDDSANSNNGTLLGSPTIAAGLKGGALQFNGSSDGVQLPDAATINTSAHQNKTVIVVFNCADVSKSEKQCVYEEGGSTRGLTIYVHQGSVYAAGWNRADYTPQWNPGTFLSAPIGSNEWHVVVAVLRGGTAGQTDDKFEMWMDGEMIAKGPGGEFRGRSDDNGIGNVQQQTNFHDGTVNAGYWFGGLIDELWILNTALNEDELGALSIGPRPLASSPTPRKDGMLDDTMSMLTWKAGDFAASHDLYLGTSAEEIEAATPESTAFKGSLTASEFFAMDLVPGQTYYWRVDEINPAELNSPWKGEVWSFRVRPSTAWDPTPAAGLQYVGLGQDLSWNAGLGAVFHTVFVGTSFDEVNNAVAGMMSADPTYEPGPLQPGTTYYWRVDEFAFPANVTHKGEVWSFTTVPEIPVTDPNLVGWWTFEEGIGLTAVDWSGRGNHGTINGTPARVLGYHGEALEFDGNSYVNCGTGDTLKIRDRITVACWIKVASFTRNWEAILAMGDDSYRMSRSATTGNSVHFGCNGPTGGNLDGVTTVTGDKWHHVALVYDGTTKIIYLDGVEDARVASTGQINASAYALYIGANSQQTGRFLEGLVDDVRIYNRALTDKDIEAVMRGDPLLAGAPEPGRGAIVNAAEVTALRWSAGDTAASHNVYFGQDRVAVAGADANALEFKGNQKGVSFSLAGLVAFGGGDYFWRIDEVESDGTVHKGYVWQFTIPDFLTVEDFESYTDLEGERIYETWEDGWTNQTGSQVGNLQAPFAEQTIVNSGGQAMPLTYDNTAAPGVSETDRTFAPAQDWTAEGVTTLVIHFRGASANTGQLYVKINGTKVPYNGAAGDLASIRWTAWKIDLAATGVNLASVKTLTIGVEGGSGVLYVDDIRLTR